MEGRWGLTSTSPPLNLRYPPLPHLSLRGSQSLPGGGVHSLPQSTAGIGAECVKGGRLYGPFSSIYKKKALFSTSLATSPGGIGEGGGGQGKPLH